MVTYSSQASKNLGPLSEVAISPHRRPLFWLAEGPWVHPWSVSLAYP